MTTATRATKATNARKFFGTVTPEAEMRIAADIAERRGRLTKDQTNTAHEHTRLWDERMPVPVGPSIYEMFIKPLGLAACCRSCRRQVELGGNCPGLRKAEVGRELVPGCHSVHDGDRDAIQRAMDPRETAEPGTRDNSTT